MLPARSAASTAEGESVAAIHRNLSTERGTMINLSVRLTACSRVVNRQKITRNGDPTHQKVTYGDCRENASREAGQSCNHVNGFSTKLRLVRDRPVTKMLSRRSYQSVRKYTTNCPQLGEDRAQLRAETDLGDVHELIDRGDD